MTATGATGRGDGIDRAKSLAGVPLFAGIDQELERADTPLEQSPWFELASSAEPERIAAGEWLWRQGDAGDSLYVVLTGRLEVVIEEEPEPRVIRVLGRGAAVGELALLTESARSASVRARRDSELLRVDRDRFNAVLEARPDFARSLTRVIGRQLRDVRHQGLDPDPVPSTVALVPLAAGVPIRDLAQYLQLVLSQGQRVLVLDETSVEHDRAHVALDRAERQHDQVLLAAAVADLTDVWTSFCLRQADRVVAVAAAGLPNAPSPRLRGCDLLVLADVGGELELQPLLDALEPRAVNVVRSPARRPPVLEAVSRRLSGSAVGLVLSGGGARAFAHIGVLEEIEARGLAVDRVGGTSGGAFIGGQYAMGRSPAEILETCRREFIEGNPLNDYTLPIVALTRSRKGRAMMARVFGDTRIEELDRDYFCISCDMLSGEQVVHRRGRVRDAAAASMTLPGILPPYALDGRILLDGGLLNNLPVDVMAATGEGPMIAVDVSARFEAPASRPPRFRRRRLARVAARAREAIVGYEWRLPSFNETITRSIVLGSMDTTEAANRYADVVIFPDVAGYPMLSWEHIDLFREAGRVAAREAFDRAPAGVLG